MSLIVNDVYIKGFQGIENIQPFISDKIVLVFAKRV
jgi:hypothetical protein